MTKAPPIKTVASVFWNFAALGPRGDHTAKSTKGGRSCSKMALRPASWSDVGKVRSDGAAPVTFS